MLKLFRKQCGAVSIFLIIVLVPILMVSSIFVDMSRIKLAGAMAESAGDLTLNTALTNYDAVLKNMYGLFATSQNMDELFLNLEDYYRQSIEAAGVPEDNVDDYVAKVMSFLKTSTGTDDLMNITVTDFNAFVPDDGHLGNPAVMKSQIVEFMKYRAPINLGMGLFDAITGMTKLDEQTKLVDNKTEFYGKQQELLNELEEGWKDIVRYQYLNKIEGFPTGTYIETQVEEIEKYESDFKDRDLANIVKYLNNYENYKKYGYYLGYNVILSSTQWWVNGDPYYSSYTTEATVEDVQALAQTIIGNVQNVKKHEDILTPLLGGIKDKSKVEQVYIIAKYNALYHESYSNDISILARNLIDLECALKSCPEEDLDKAKKDNSVSLKTWCQNQIKEHLHTNPTGHFGYYNDVISRLNFAYARTEYVVDESYLEVDQTISFLIMTMGGLNANIDTCIGYLNDAIGHFQNVNTMLADPNSDYNKTLTAWKESANGLSDETMGQNDLEEISKVKDMVTEERVNNLIERLTAAKTSLELVMSEIAKYEFEGVLWKDLSSASDYTTINSLMASRNIASIVPKGENAYDSIIDDVKWDMKSGSIKTSWEGDEENAPDLSKNQRELHTWLYKNYGVDSYKFSSTTSQTNSKDGDVDSIKSNLKSQADANNKEPSGSGSTEVSTSIGDYQSQLPSTLWENKKKDDSTSSTDALKTGEVKTDQDEMMESSNGSAGLGTFLKDITSEASKMATSLRDRLYVADYVMKMFSYDTYEAEIVAKKTGKAGAFDNWYEKKDDKYVIKDSCKEYEALALNMTNNPINPNNNYLYGSEIEYIIYGTDNPENSVGAAYGTIFMIRFAFNTVYAFTDAEINNIAMTAATAVFGTPPLTPLIPIAKVAIILGFAIAESAYDLYQLKCGAAVPLMKSKDTWTMSTKGAVNAIANEVTTAVADKVIDEGYKVFCDAIEKTDEELSAMLSDEGVLNSFADTLVDNSFEQLYNYANEALQQAVQICNDVNLSQQFINEADEKEAQKLLTKEGKAELVAEKLTVWLGTAESSNDVFYEVKKIAVDKLKENNNANIIKILDSIDATAETTSLDNLEAPELLNSVLNKIKAQVNTSIQKLTEKANGVLDEYKKELKKSILDSADEGVESFRATVQEKISGTFGNSPKNTNASSNVMSSLMNWTYSDYLFLFLLVSILANEEDVILRIADVIELNMQHMDGEYAVITTTETVKKSILWGLITYEKEESVDSVNDAAFKLQKSYTHVQIDATLEVEPLFMDMPFMKDTTESILSGKNWYQVQYSGTLGY